MTGVVARRRAPKAELVPEGTLELHHKPFKPVFPFELWWIGSASRDAIICAVAETEAEGRDHLDWAAQLAEATAGLTARPQGA